MLELPPPNFFQKAKIVIEQSIPKSNYFLTSIKTKEVKDNPYNELICTDVDKRKIYHIIHTLGTNGKLALLFKHKKKLEKFGDEIRHVHPLKFLGYIFSNNILKNDMKKIMNDYFVRKNFMKDLSIEMTNELKNGSVRRIIKSFSEKLHVHENELIPFIEKKDWHGFVNYLAKK